MEAFHFSYTLTNARNNATTTSNTGNTTRTRARMDGRIWSQIPQRLLDRVLAFLPPPAFFRARCVCKRWYSLLYSNAFLQLYLQLSPSHPFFLFFNHQTIHSHNINQPTRTTTTTHNHDACYLFDPHEFQWYRIPLANLLPSGFTPASSSGGLICLISDNGGPKSLILFNPILGTLSYLPPTLRHRLLPSIGLFITPSSIDVTIAGDDLISPFAVKNLTAETFHIDGGGFYSIWATTSSLPRLCSFGSNAKMVQVQGKFYCMNYSPFIVLAYDIIMNNWWKIQAPMRRFLRSPSLVEGKGGKLLLVGAVEKSKLNVPKSLRVWGLQECGTTWVELERMPQQLFVEFEEVESGNGFDCLVNGEFLVINVKGYWDKCLLFDMDKKVWQWIPPCPYLLHCCSGGGGRELHGFAYEPRLATPVTGLLHQLSSSVPF